MSPDEVVQIAVDAVIAWIEGKHGEWGDFCLGSEQDIRDRWIEAARAAVAEQA